MKLGAEALRDPAGQADVVGMPMRRDHAGDALVEQRTGKDRLPERARRFVVDARVNQRVAVAVLDQIDVDVVKTKRKRQTQPEDTR